MTTNEQHDERTTEAFAPERTTDGVLRPAEIEVVNEPSGSARLVQAFDFQPVVRKLLQDDPRLISRHTTRQYESDLLTFDRWRNGRPITKTLVEEYAASLQAEGKAPSTINQKLAAIRWYARKMSDLAIDYGKDDESARQAARVATVRDVKGERPERGRHIDQGELAALIQTCLKDKSPAGVRDAAIIAIAWSTGLRREEIAGIQMTEIVNQTDDGCDVAIMGKGGKFRNVYVNDGAYAALCDWIALRGNEPGAVFQSVNKGGTIAGGRLSGEAMRKMLDKRAEQAGLSKALTWHDFRRTFAGNLWDAKIDGVTIQKLMGHASQNQTAKYDRRPEDARRQAVKVLHVPYKRK